MNEDFVKYEDANHLMHLGFNEECPGYYFITADRIELVNSKVLNNNALNSVAAPTKEQALKWSIKQLILTTKK